MMRFTTREEKLTKQIKTMNDEWELKELKKMCEERITDIYDEYQGYDSDLLDIKEYETEDLETIRDEYGTWPDSDAKRLAMQMLLLSREDKDYTDLLKKINKRIKLVQEKKAGFKKFIETKECELE
jgi:CII-binding regulator of phage lambda lysogenization HflD